jgi:hypothetical protein
MTKHQSSNNNQYLNDRNLKYNINIRFGYLEIGNLELFGVCLPAAGRGFGDWNLRMPPDLS